jgi:hypothetical protein
MEISMVTDKLSRRLAERGLYCGRGELSLPYIIHSCANVKISFSPQDNCYPISTIGLS